MKIIFTLLGILLVIKAEAQKPNVIIVMTDDQGYGELSFHGNPVLKTPNLDRLATGSIRFMDYHATPMCTPTRGELMTGLDAARNGAVNVSSGRTMLRSDLPTMADLFTQDGYETGMFGKWHLGDSYPYRPIDRGFDEAIWFPASHLNGIPNVWDSDYFDDTYYHNDQPKSYPGYCTDVFFENAIEWMKEQAGKNQPFLAYIPTNTPHGPHWAPQEDIEALEKDFEQSILNDIEPGLQKRLTPYLAMIRNIDTNIGRLLRFLDEEGLAGNTILIFTTDNGSSFGSRYYNAGMRGKKREVWEGGHRVPLFIRYPQGDLGENRDIHTLTQVKDLLPTLLELCSIDVEQKFDGASLVPMLRQGDQVLEERMVVINYSRMPFKVDQPVVNSPSLMRKEGSVVLWKKWRLIYGNPPSASNNFIVDNGVVLNDLVTDPLQEKNVADLYPDITQKMLEHLDRWWDDVKQLANEPQPVYIGSDLQNPVMLNSCEWMDVFMDSQSQVRDGLPRNSHWKIQVMESGKYEFELRRWPRESGLNLRDSIPTTKVTAGILNPGVSLPIASAEIEVADAKKSRRLKIDADSAIFRIKLNEGPAKLQTWFKDEEGNPLCGAYYVYVKKL